MKNRVKLEKVGYLIADNEIIPFITNTRETHIKSFVQFSNTLENALITCTIKQQKQSASIHNAIQKSLDRKEKNQFEF